MSLFAILLFVGTMVLSLWATMRVRQVYGEFSQLPASSGLTGAETAATILRQEGIYDVEIVERDEALGDHYDPTQKRLVLSRDRANTGGGRRDGGRKRIARSGLDLRCRLHHVAWLLPFASFTSDRRTQRVTNI
jgi:hypothetical protein